MYYSFRNARTKQKQFDYHQFQNEAGGEVMAAEHHAKKGPPRPPQPSTGHHRKSQSLPETDEGLLIDLTEETVPVRVSPQGESSSKENDAVSLLDTSISEKYQFLPAPLGEKEDDPFEINPSVIKYIPDLLSGSATDAYNRSVNVSGSVSAIERSVRESQPVTGMYDGSVTVSEAVPQPVPVACEVSVNVSGTAPQPVSSPCESISSGSDGSFSSAASSEPVYATAQSPASRNSYITPAYYGNVPDTQRKSPEGGADAPPLPPRIYANVPGTSDIKPKKPLPPLPTNQNSHATAELTVTAATVMLSQQTTSISPQTSLMLPQSSSTSLVSPIGVSSVSPLSVSVSASVPPSVSTSPHPPTSRYYSMVASAETSPASTTTSPHPPTSHRYYSIVASPETSPEKMTPCFYDVVPDEMTSPNRYYSDRYGSATGHSTMFSNQYTNIPDYTGQHCKVEAPKVEKVEKAFDWLNEAVSGFSFDKSADRAQSANMTENFGHDKSALESWDSKNLLRNTSTKSASASPAKTAGVNHSKKWEQFDQNPHRHKDDPPPLPPKNIKAPVYSNVPGQSQGPRIHPIIQDGKQLSWTHYWLLPEKGEHRKSGTAPTAEVKPFSVGGSQYVGGATGGPKSRKDTIYQNLADINPGIFSAKNVDISQSWMASGKADMSASVGPIGGASSKFAADNVSFSWTGMTGLKAVSAEQPPLSHTMSPRHQRFDALRVNVPSVGTAAASTATLKEKLNTVFSQVDGVTDEECHTALSNHHWDVNASVKYLKLEQLFRLGIASREHCQKLLNTYKWNLEVAGSALLDELSTGSAV